MLYTFCTIFFSNTIPQAIVSGEVKVGEKSVSVENNNNRQNRKPNPFSVASKSCPSYRNDFQDLKPRSTEGWSRNCIVALPSFSIRGWPKYQSGSLQT